MKSNIPTTYTLAALTTEVKYAIIERSWSRYGHDASSTNGFAKNTVRRWNKAERKAAKAFCRTEVGNSRIGPIRMGTYHAVQEVA
jgi:hypothetical protein